MSSLFLKKLHILPLFQQSLLLAIHYSTTLNNSIWTIHFLHTFTAPMGDSSLFKIYIPLLSGGKYDMASELLRKVLLHNKSSTKVTLLSMMMMMNF